MKLKPNNNHISNLLLVEDDPAQLQTMQDILLDEGFSVLTSSTIAEAMQLIQTEDFTLAVIDLRLDEESGIKLLEQFQTCNVNFKIIIHTGYGSYDTAKDALNYGAFAYVEKCGNPDILLAHVHRAYTEYNKKYIEELETSIHDTEQKFARIFNESKDAIWITTLNEGCFLEVNRNFESFSGYSRKEVIGKNITEIGIYTDLNVRENLLDLLKKNAAISNFEMEFRPKNGDRHLVELSSSNITIGDTRCIVSIGRDITARKKMEEELRKLSRAVESSSSAILITDHKLNIEFVNSRFSEINGYSKEEIMGSNLDILRADDNSSSGYANLFETITLKGEWKGELQNQKKNGSLYWCRTSFSCIRDKTGKITHFVSIQEDVTQEYKLIEQLSYQASHDALTGLFNRDEFERRINCLIASLQQASGEHALCYMDLDQFKIVNDTCGHMAGDEMLRQLSLVLQNQVRKHDTLARLGGDEFAVLMEHCSLEQAHRVASSLQRSIQSYQFSWKGNNFKVGVSIGLVAITEVIPNLSKLLQNADAACYMAKNLGRNRIHVYHEEDMSLAKRHGEMQWVARIHQALEEDLFCLYAQSIVSLQSGNDQHYELLLRMKDKTGKIIPPGAFLPAAERYNLIEKIDSWVVINAFNLLADNPAFVKKIHCISINLSDQSLTNHEFLNTIIFHLNKSGIEKNKICFEITETSAIANLSAATKFISSLRKLGCRFALDDFGSGLSSFAYLKNLPVDYLKIDGMFVKDIADDPINWTMVKSINDICQMMGIQTIAEFVENNTIKEMLKNLGVNYAQGYGIDKPQAFTEILAKITPP